MSHVLVSNIDPALPYFATPRSVDKWVSAWASVDNAAYLKKEFSRILRGIKDIARSLLAASAVEQLDQSVTENIFKYLALKAELFGLVKLTLSKEGVWTAEELAGELGRAYDEFAGFVRTEASVKLQEDSAEKLVSAVEGLVLFSTRLMEIMVHGKPFDASTLALCLDPFNKADLLVFASFLALHGEMMGYSQSVLGIIAERADGLVTDMEDILISSRFEFPDEEPATSLEEYLKRKAG